MSGWLISLGVSLGMTLVIECAFAFFCSLRGRDLTLCVLVNVLTNPIVVICALLWRHFVPLPEWWPIPLLELGAVVTEGLIYRDLSEKLRRPLLFSLCANALSYGLGLVFDLIL